MTDHAMTVSAPRRDPVRLLAMAKPGWRTLGGCLVLGAAAIVFGYEVKSISDVYGWWLDDLCSLYFSDPTRSFPGLFVRRILADSNPPLYYTALFVARLFVGDPRTTMLLLNVLVIGGTVTFLGLIARRLGMLGFALVGVAVFLVSGPVLHFAVQGRCYVTALMLVYVVSWLSALALDETPPRPARWYFPLLGGLAALTHVYAGLFCCCLAAGLVLCSLLFRRRDLIAYGLTLGIAASTTMTVWFVLFGWKAVSNLHWIVFTAEDTAAAGYHVEQMIFGRWQAVAAFAAVFIASVFVRKTRPLATVLGVSAVLFVAVPSALSLVLPMIDGRYWLVGAPLIFVFLTFVARSALSGWRTPADRRLRAVTAAGIVGLLLAMDGSGFVEARQWTTTLPFWTGAALAEPLLSACGPGSVHVNLPMPLFASAAHAPQDIFVDVVAARPDRDDRPSPGCPVLGWAEHLGVYDGLLRRAGNEELMRLLRIDAPLADVEIDRHTTGYVVLRKHD